MSLRRHGGASLRALLSVFSLAALVGSAIAEGVAPAGELSKGSVARVLEGGLVIQFEILPLPIRALKDLDFIVTLTRGGKPVEGAEVSLELTMPAMYMGKNSPTLVQVRAGRFEGKGILPRCMSGDRRWQAELLVREAGGSFKVLFPFETT